MESLVVLNSRMMQEACEGSWHDSEVTRNITCRKLPTLVVIYRLCAWFEKKKCTMRKGTVMKKKLSIQ